MLISGDDQVLDKMSSSALVTERANLVVRRGRKAVTTDETESLNEHTRLMLAVRDNRDKSAFAALFDFFAPRVKAMARRGGLGNDQAEDLAQDVLLTVWRKAGQFDPSRAQVSAWVYQIARNRQVDIVRKENRPVPEELQSEESADAPVENTMAFQQEAGKLRLAMENLPEQQREMVKHAYLGELSHAEIRNVTGLPLGTIKSRIRLGLERLRHELKEMREI